MRFTLGVTALVALSACSPSIPDSGAGVGFNDYDTYQQKQQARNAALAGQAVPQAGVVSDEVTGASMATSSTGSTDSAVLAAETQAALNATTSNSGVAPVDASPSNPPPQTVTTASGISSENDFEAVGAQRSIESDAQLIAQNRSQYQVIAPTALPSRSGGDGPNIVQYALSSTHPRGTKVYSRVSMGGTSKYQRNCAQYASPDLAQEDFLAKGGPNRDKLGLDPDGDGYACTWDPTPFRKAVRG